ncbi:MAG: c-type cytochrome [Opitutae bacterium]|nr:c-type cytochrome [Opitutae bacterium]MBT4666531.1 c-type cytochrome [Opitutae bacterium]MBT5909552.1 c-type cytochrome [Opitutae bacterium]MBT6849905.1 c-type cytochrome [Opitutae bacterium]MBT7741566.1 c-type cytochrome [Opitutae bacterium]
MMKNIFANLLFALFVNIAFAEEEASPKDRLIVETLTRLERFDISGNEKWKGAVERYARSLRGKEGYFELVDQFSVKAEAPALIQFVKRDPSAADAAKAVQLLFRLGHEQSITNALATGPKGKADAIAKLVGFIQTPEAKKLLEEYRVTDKPASTIAGAAPALLATPEDIALLAKRKGDPVSGKAVFQKLCFACHKAGDVGIDFGPGLSEIGSKLPKTELYLAIVKPNAGISFDYEGWVVETRQNGVLAGIVSESDEKLTVRMIGGVSQKVNNSDVLKREKMKLSLMPEGLHLAMSEEELVDLVEFLAGLKKK